MNHEQIKEEKSSILTLLLSSILLHMLLILAVILYRMAPDLSPEKQRISTQDNIIIWTNPNPKIMPVQSIPKIQTKKTEKSSPEEKKEEPDYNFLKKAPIITPGRQGLDEQNISDINTTMQTTEKVTKEEQKNSNHKETTLEKKPLQTTHDTAFSSSLKNSTLEQNITPTTTKTSLTDSNEASTHKELDKRSLKFDTNFIMFPKAKSVQNAQANQTTKKNGTKSISFKDISLGFNNAATNIGNSQHLMIQGTSPDIPQGEELKYITFINQMANMIVASIRTHQKINSIPHRTNEKIICFMKVHRTGQLLDTKIIIPSKHEILNMIIIESIQNVGLFNSIPKFIKKDTFEINWHILT
ncbi:hypothetical protein HYV10_02760 [Candidatus Dependentiae bacterium]|nr:hypothetical protein [Candidatus Dependentiae bacterium]